MRDEGWPDLREVLRPRDIELSYIGVSAAGNLYSEMEPFTVFENDRVKGFATLAKKHPGAPCLRLSLRHGRGRPYSDASHLSVEAC